ncbi:MAG: mannitol dehydrogenase [Clostridiaceae bacterium]|nr:mannitol dehydrogenase [Clostridiaceae bacterium]
MKAVMYGAGNIGRGFIGALFSQSGYEVIFIDVNEQVVSALSKEKRYPVRFVSNEKYEDICIEGVTAVDGNNIEAAGNAIASCDIMATAVGSRALEYIVPNIVSGLRQRWKRTRAPFNIIICENLLDADKFLRMLINAELTAEEQVLFDDSVGLIEASIGRMVPVQTLEMQDGNPLRVCVEEYGFLPTDKAAFKGRIPQIKNMVPFEPFDFYIKRKLYIHNMGHATCAYLGDYIGLDYIYEAINLADIRIIVQNAMQDSAMALSEKYDMRLNPVLLHVEDLLSRFNNAALGDTCERVGGDLDRKLSPEDRMIGSARLSLEQGILPVYIAVGIAAGVRRMIEENPELKQSEETAVQILQQVSELDQDDQLTKLVIEMYRLFIEGKTMAEIRRKADQVKAESLYGII